MSDQKQQNDFLSQWAELQKNFFSQWTEFAGRTDQPWADASMFWSGMKAPGLDIFSKWSEMIQETIGKASQQTGGGLGPDVLSRILSSGNVFVIFNKFWQEVSQDIPALLNAKGDEAKSREIFESWMSKYQQVFEQLMGSPIPEDFQDMMTSWLNSMQNRQAAMGLMWNPWLQTMPKWREQSEKFMKGDWGAIPEARSLFREVYDDTLGRVFRMPALGLNKQQTERLRKTYDAFVQFQNAQPKFFQLFNDTGTQALKEVFTKVQNMKSEDLTPETMQEIYKVWWTTNEDAFFQLFNQPEFGQTMSEALNSGFRLKMRLDDLSADLCQALSIPTNKEYDEAAKAIHELRRKVRLQQKAIEALEHQAAQAAQEG